ncbi:MAG: hypothetical protein RLY46_1342 [Bacteroidota bacterium]
MIAAPKLANVVIAAARCSDLGPFSANTFVAIMPAMCTTANHLCNLIAESFLSLLIKGGGAKNDMAAVAPYEMLTAVARFS